MNCDCGVHVIQRIEVSDDYLIVTTGLSDPYTRVGNRDWLKCKCEKIGIPFFWIGNGEEPRDGVA